MPEVERKSKITASRKLMLKSLMLAKAKECWEQEHEEREAEKVRYLSERIPTLQTRGLSLSALQDLCRELHAKVCKTQRLISNAASAHCTCHIVSSGKDLRTGPCVELSVDAGIIAAIIRVSKDRYQKSMTH